MEKNIILSIQTIIKYVYYEHKINNIYLKHYFL